MKPCVLLSSDSGIEELAQHKHVLFFPDRIVFSEDEIYYNSKEMLPEAFISRLRLDENAKPVMKGANKKDTLEVLNKANSLEYDTFIVILTEKKMQYYKPMIEEFISNNQEITAHYYTIDSVFYPVCYMAVNIIKMLDNGKTIEDVNKYIEFISSHNAVFLYSPEEERYPSIQKFSYDDDLLRIQGNNNHFYIIHPSGTTTYRVKERIKSIEYYLKLFKTDIENKNVIPFIQYTDLESLNMNVFRGLSERLFGKTKCKEIMLSPEAASLYGMNACGIGYIEKYEE